MWSNSREKGLSAERITQLYSNRKQTSSVAQPLSNEPLSISAQYVLKQLKKRLQGASHNLDTEEIIELVRDVEAQEAEFLSDRERVATAAAFQKSLDHYDILTPLIENPAINDIIISRFDNISVQIGRRNIQTDLRFASRETYCAFIEQLLKRAGKACSTATPVVDVAVDPNIRVCATHESFSPQGEGPLLTIRVARRDRMSGDALVTSGMLPEVILNYLSAITRDGSATILIAGEVGTGKTTLVRVLANSIDRDDALLIIEDTHELMLERQFSRTLLTRESNTEGAGKIAPSEAIRAGMRMAMNRVILGEMRDAEAAEAFVDVCASGHPGMSTIHSRSARDAINRLELFLLRAQPGVGVDVVRRLIANSVSVIVYLGLDAKTRRRRVVQVEEVVGAGDGQVQTSPIFSFDENSSSAGWIRQSGISKFSDVLQNQEINLPAVGQRIEEITSVN